MVYKLAKKIIVVSNRATEFMIKEEGVAPNKILQINLAYDFNLYSKVNSENVKEIKNNYSADLIIAFAGRLVEYKRAELCLELTEKLIQNKINVKCLILGDGPIYEKLRHLIQERKLEKSCILLGHKTNILDYMAAADIFFHPSISESSCVVVKEAGLVKKPVIICEGVGDFNDYIKNGINGIVVSKNDPIPVALDFLKKFSLNKEAYKDLGENLFKDVKELFSINSVLPSYNSINKPR